MPEVSVIIPNYNHASFLRQRIDSVLNQTYQDFEVIILDDCSTDNSRVIIEAYRTHPKVSHVIYNHSNSGSTFKQWNKGAKLAKGNYIWIAESDDFCENSFLEVAVFNLTKNNCDLFYCMSKQVDSAGQILNNLEWWYKDLHKNRWKSSYISTSSEELRNYLIKKNTIVNASAVVFRKNELVNGFLSNIVDFKYCGDWLFWLQYLHKSSKISYSQKTINYFRTHSNTTRSGNIQKRNDEISLIYKWIRRNIIHEIGYYSILAYFSNNHFSIYPRKYVLKNLRVLFSLDLGTIASLIVFLQKYFKFLSTVK